MNNSFKTVALVGLFTDSRVAEPMIRLAKYLAKAGITVLANTDIADTLSARAVADDALARNADLIIAVGGDGTMLHAAGLAANVDVPLLGVNRGRLGFLADVSPDDMLESLDQVLGGKDAQVFLGCQFPADEAYRVEIQNEGMKAANLLLQQGVLGRSAKAFSEFFQFFIGIFQFRFFSHFFNVF